MENSFDNRDFERFVKHNADQYRMFPSEKIWRNIHHSLHARNRWYGFGLALLLLTAIAVTWVMLIPSNKNQQLADTLPLVLSKPAAIQTQQKPAAIITPARPVQVQRNDMASAEFSQKNLFIAGITEMPERVNVTVESSTLAPVISEPVISTTSINTTELNISHAPVYSSEIPVINKRIESAKAGKPEQLVVDAIAVEPIMADATNTSIAVKDKALLPIESVVNSNIQVRKKNRFSLRAYFTPTVSYRRLKENNQFLSATQSVGSPSTTTLAIADVNSVVTHKPDIGLQLGVNAGYVLNHRFTFTAGLQFNLSKYDIRAYDYPSETATIALISRTARPSSVSKETTYRVNSGSKSADWLQNMYFSASIPLGLELRLSGSDKTEIGVGGTIQPTYVLGNRAYILSTDYKNYAEVPSLIRKWNISSGFEAYAGYSTGKLNWRVGPQVRYQLLSSFRKQYPVKEHLFDFGLKVGITLNK